MAGPETQFTVQGSGRRRCLGVLHLRMSASTCACTPLCAACRIPGSSRIFSDRDAAATVPAAPSVSTPLASAVRAEADVAVALDDGKRVEEQQQTSERRNKKKLPRGKRVLMATDRVVSFALKNTVGRIARFAGKRLLGQFPEEATTGSYHAITGEPTTTSITSFPVVGLTAEEEEEEDITTAEPATSQHGKSTVFISGPRDLEESQELLEREVMMQLAVEKVEGELIQKI